MTGISTGAARAIARQFPWDRYRTFADVGTARQGRAARDLAAVGRTPDCEFARTTPPARRSSLRANARNVR